MKIREIIVESAEQQPKPAEKEHVLTAIDNIESGIKNFIQDLSSLKNKPLSGDAIKKLKAAAKNHELEEASLKGVIGSALVGLSLLSALPAQAQSNVGNLLAVCAGDLSAMSKAFEAQGNRADAAETKKTADRALGLSEKLIGAGDALSISLGEYKSVMSEFTSYGPYAAEINKRALMDLTDKAKRCLVTLQNAEKEIKSQAPQQTQPAVQSQSNSSSLDARLANVPKSHQQTYSPPVQNAPDNKTQTVKFDDGAIFTGVIKGENYVGTLKDADGVIQKGELKKGEKGVGIHGNGEYIFPGGSFIKGLFKNGQPVSGVRKYENGDTFEGTFVSNSDGRILKGKYIFTSGERKGEVEEGEFKMDPKLKEEVLWNGTLTRPDGKILKAVNGKLTRVK